MTLRIKNTFDGFADLDCSLEDLALIKLIVAQTLRSYETLDPIHRSTTLGEIMDFERTLKTHDDVPLPLSKADIGLLLMIMRETEALIVEGADRTQHKALVDAFSRFSSLQIFETTQTQTMLARIQKSAI